MGNSHSSDLKTVSLIDSSYRHDVSRVNRYVSPQHKVLPGPITGQKLKNTDNGNILLNGGTISGRKFGRFYSIEETDAEVLAVLNRRSALIDQDDGRLDDKKRFHSDPDISNRFSNKLPKVENCSPSKAKINRAKRKNKAPPPPKNPVGIGRLDAASKSIYHRNEGYRRNRDAKLMETVKNARNAARTKSPAPRPPAQPSTKVEPSHATVPPPPPPPPPPLPQSSSFNASKTPKNNDAQKFNHLNDLNKVRNNLKTGEKKNSEERRRSPLGPNLPSTFHEDIKAALQRRLSSESTEKNSKPTMAPLKQYYFSGRSTEEKLREFSAPDEEKVDRKADVPKPKQQYYFGANISHVQASSAEKDHPQRQSGRLLEKKRQSVGRDGIKKEVDEFAPNCDAIDGDRRSRVSQSSDHSNSWFRSEFTGTLRNGMKSYRRSRSLSSSSSSSFSDEEASIRMSLKPTVPLKKAQNPPKFSPTQAWRSLSVDSVTRNRNQDVSSDDTDHYENKRNNSYKSRQRRPTKKSNDIGTYESNNAVYDKYSKYCAGDSKVKPKTHLADGEKQHWTPEQDLSDDYESTVFDDRPFYKEKDPGLVEVQPKLVTSTAFTSLPYMNYSQTESFISLSDESPKSPSEKVREKSRRTRRKSKSSTRSSDNSASNGLQSLKRSVKAALSMNRKQNQDGAFDMNWSLSRSIPGSLNNLDSEGPKNERKGRSPVRDSKKKSYMASMQDRPELFEFENNYRSLPQLNRLEKSGLRQGHVMYLPEYKAVQVPQKQDKKVRSKSKENCKVFEAKPRGGHSNDEKRKQWFLSSIENEMVQKGEDQQPEWMNRVEEEFRLKRDREKANIRQQLRVLNMELRKSNVNIDEMATQSSDSQETVSPYVDRRHRSRSEDGFLSRSPDLGRVKRQQRSASHHELREDNCGPTSYPVMESNQSAFPSFDFARQPDSLGPKPIASKGISRWFRRPASKEKEKRMEGLRPEPEGGRSSSSELEEPVIQNRRLKESKSSKPSIYKQLNDLVDREEMRARARDKMNSAGESYSESDVDDKPHSRPKSRQFQLGKGSVSSSDDGNVESGFYSGSDIKKSPNNIFSQRYSDYVSPSYEQRKVSAAYAQPFSPSKGYRPVAFNPIRSNGIKN